MSRLRETRASQSYPRFSGWRVRSASELANCSITSGYDDADEEEGAEEAAARGLQRSGVQDRAVGDTGEANEEKEAVDALDAKAFFLLTRLDSVRHRLPDFPIEFIDCLEIDDFFEALQVSAFDPCI